MVPTSDSSCAQCMSPLNANSLKCMRCSLMLHLRCSGLPEYHIVRLATTQTSYMCQKCVRLELEDEKYDEEIAQVKALMSAEEAVIKSINDEMQNDTINSELMSQANVNRSGNDTNEGARSSENITAFINNEDNSVVQNKSDEKRTVCRFYLQKSCKHGLKGTNCNYLHPKLCYKFIRNGAKNGGCKKEDCKFHHPKLCKLSLQERRCNRVKCRFFHLNGTKFEDQPNMGGIRGPERVDQNRNIAADRESFAQIVRSSDQRSSENVTRRTQRFTDEVSEPPSRASSSMPPNYPVQDFLDLK